MTSRRPVRILLGLLLSGALMSACGTTGTSTDAASAQVSSPTSGATIDAGGQGARPGGPEPTPDAGGGGARPGAPFDVQAFEQIGAPADDFLPTAREYCSGGRCTIIEKRSTNPDVEQCEVAGFDYDPPARPPGAPANEQFIQRGTKVTVLIDCPPETAGGSSGSGESAGGSAGGSAGESSGSSSSSGA
jgi:hypothetical protein